MEIYFQIELPSNITVPLSHSSELDFDGEWEECEYNYRLNICDETIYAVENGTVVAHLGIRENEIKAICVDEGFQGQGVTYQLYAAAFKVYRNLFSDDAREPAATHIWEKMMEMYPGKIKYHAKRDQFEYNEDGFED